MWVVGGTFHATTPTTHSAQEQRIDAEWGACRGTNQATPAAELVPDRGLQSTTDEIQESRHNKESRKKPDQQT